MKCPWAATTLLTFCAGTDMACDVGPITHLHLFKVQDNLLTFDVQEGQHYEFLLPADREHHGLWHWEGVTPSESTPDFKDRIDPFALSGFYSMGVFRAKLNSTMATIRRLAGSDRIGICRIDPPQNIQGVAWLALPWSRASVQIWNQPLNDTPHIPLPWVTCFISMIFLQLAHVPSTKRPTIDITDTIVTASLLTDIIVWLSLGVCVFEDSSIENSTYGANATAAYTGLFLAALVILFLRERYRADLLVHIALGFAALFTSALYVTTFFLWVWAFSLTRYTAPPAYVHDLQKAVGQLAF